MRRRLEESASKFNGKCHFADISEPDQIYNGRSKNKTLNTMIYFCDSF